MPVTAGVCFYARVAKVATRVESCLCLLLGKVAGEDETELAEVVGLNFGRTTPSLPRALGAALEVRRVFYPHLAVVGVLAVGPVEDASLRSLVADCARLLVAPRPLLGVHFALDSPSTLRLLDRPDPVRPCAGPVDRLSFQALRRARNETHMETHTET